MSRLYLSSQILIFLQQSVWECSNKIGILNDLLINFIVVVIECYSNMISHIFGQNLIEHQWFRKDGSKKFKNRFKNLQNKRVLLGCLLFLNTAELALVSLLFRLASKTAVLGEPQEMCSTINDIYFLYCCESHHYFNFFYKI